MYRGKDYPCTGHAHFAGLHIHCTSTAHQATPPAARADDQGELRLWRIQLAAWLKANTSNPDGDRWRLPDLLATVVGTAR